MISLILFAYRNGFLKTYATRATWIICLCNFLFGVQLKIIKTFLYHMDISCIYPCKCTCMLLYAIICSIHRKQQFWQNIFGNINNFMCMFISFFLLCSSNLVCEAIIVGISWSHYCLNSYRKGTGTVLLWYDRSSNFQPRTPLRIRQLSYTHSQWVFDRWQLLRWGLGVTPAIISL